MGRSKWKKKIQQEKSTVKQTEESTNTKVPIHNLPEKFLWMHVKSGTKIRNVLGYAMKEFPSYNSIVWTGTGSGIAKTISCAEIFKRKYENLHQVTKLRYVSSEKSKEDTVKAHRIPEVHILLTKDIKDTTELGYQAPGDSGRFLRNENATESKTTITTESTDDTKMGTVAENAGDVNADIRTKNTDDVKIDTTESTSDVKTGSSTENIGDVSCIDEQSRIMKKNKKRKKNKAIENAELPSKKKKHRD
ncbi:Alba-like protein C9orf23 like protein [Trachymyrmex septentrionalis]|uniref:Alba-like protein C9orf23 like protein n=2 Tax=Trachymyrmex septentrionalis TaxID=34720 RepID=A0A195F9C6_9HYME|nr:PREDICTED: ribonuclease P protein subunit p25 isoform X2 [Trachymyrmex septentrionalis]XP_018345592.1 PREDICTED: ribonuclease P protein subunit p25 isoform X2 [Trachymyrmex septentrionalis]KYN36981.1 Alba-like protein C9orf23 like protein [Trachymyrmex septentrionalis]